MKQLCCALFTLCLIMSPVLRQSSQAASRPDQPDPAGTPGQSRSGAALSPACVRFNDLNSLIRDGRIDRESARNELRLLLAEVRQGYYLAGGKDFPHTAWVFPLAGYDVRAIEGGRRHGFIPSGYDYFAGNRHGGHPAFDIFIRDGDRDCRDDRSGRPVKVLSLTGGIVVAMEREWEPGSRLRGGRYLWVYDPGDDLLVYYAHNNELFVELGRIVKPGDVLATVGRSGYNAAKRRSPTHLHLSVLRVREVRPLPVNVYRQLGRAKTTAETE